MYKYSIIMPVYNSEKSLDKSIKSIIKQTYHNWELIIIDDGSTDKSYEIISNYSKLDKRIKIYHQNNKGPGLARNKGIKLCRGDYIVFLDSDDYYELDFLQTVDSINAKKPKDLLFVSTLYEKPNGTLEKCDNLSKFSKCSKHELLKLQITGTIPWGPCSKVVKSKIVKKCKFSELVVGEEIVYSFDVLNSANTYDFCDKPFYHYVHNNIGQHTKGGNDPWYQVVGIMKNHLISINALSEYASSLNALALNALSISIYRNSCKYKRRMAIREIKKSIKKYTDNYNITSVDYSLLSLKNKIILVFIKLNFLNLLFLASKIRNKFK